MFFTVLLWKTSISTALQVANSPSSVAQLENGYYIGIMSGTSMDAIDAVLVEFDSNGLANTAACHSSAFPDSLKANLTAIVQPSWTGSLKHIASLNATLGSIYAETAEALIQKSNIPKDKINAIGNHGQTIWHQPDDEPHFSWQLGDANRIAELTGVTTVADFRNRDIAAGGEGAPLVPAFHKAVFSHSTKNRVILNIGGIANISLLSPNQNTLGFDTGPGNSLLDAWCLENQNKPFDKDGAWGATGKLIKPLLDELMTEPYFKRGHPKSTGKEHFNLQWLKQKLTSSMTPEDVQATLVEVTALSIAEGIKLASKVNQLKIDEVYVCGGGSKNLCLMQRLKQLLNSAAVDKTDSLGVDADWVEAIAFAWLARQTMLGLPGNLPSATGATGFRVLGAIYPA
jgi:anhydro-N-acetylmuramic acid kinase